MIEGKAASISEITGNYVVSIFDNGTNFIQIEATAATVEGRISEMYDDETVVIGKKIYGISPSYNALIESGARFTPVKNGMEATFRLNVIGNIAYVGETEEQYKSAILKKIGTVDSSFDSSVCARMFNDNGDWVETFLANKVEIDSEKYTDQESAAEYITSIADEIATTIIRYKLNSDRKKLP